MSIINKTDFYCGAFVSYLASNRIAPTLFDGTDNSKISKFIIGRNDYKVYIKYSASCKYTKYDKVDCRRWDVIFTDKELEILKHFLEGNCIIYLVIVCTDETMIKTEIAVLDHKKALQCLGDDTINDVRRISILHKKGSKYLQYYGTAVDKEKANITLKNFESYFRSESEIASL